MTEDLLIIPLKGIEYPVNNIEVHTGKGVFKAQKALEELANLKELNLDEEFGKGVN